MFEFVSPPFCGLSLAGGRGDMGGTTKPFSKVLSDEGLIFSFWIFVLIFCYCIINSSRVSDFILYKVNITKKMIAPIKKKMAR